MAKAEANAMANANAMEDVAGRNDGERPGALLI